MGNLAFMRLRSAVQESGFGPLRCPLSCSLALIRHTATLIGWSNDLGYRSCSWILRGIRGPEPPHTHAHTHPWSDQNRRIHTSAVLQTNHTDSTVMARQAPSHDHTTQQQVISLRNSSNVIIKWYFSQPFVSYFFSFQLLFIGFENLLITAQLLIRSWKSVVLCFII